MVDPDLAEARLAATAAALAGDSGTLYHLVSELLDEGMPFDSVLFDVLVPTEQDIGTRWQRGDYLVSEEHAATATVETVVSLFTGTFDQPSGGTRVVVAAAEGDHHSLPARLLAAYLLFLGYRTTFLGANVLASDLGEYLAADPPDAVALSCAMTNHLLGARAGIRASHAAGVPVIVGGRAFGETGDRATNLGADAWVPDPRQVPEVLDRWSPDPEAAERAAAEPSDDLLEVIHRRASITAGAQRELAITRPGGVQPRLAMEISLLLGAVEAAMLIGDEEPIAEMLRWQEATLAAHGLEVAGDLAEALRASLSDASPAAGDVLARAMLQKNADA